MVHRQAIRFLGVDLGWQSGPTGLCCLAKTGDQLVLESLDRLATVDEILDWIDDWTGSLATAVVAVDAPTLIPNQTGMRRPDRLAHKYFGKYDAGCYPANRNRPFAEKLIAFGLALESRGFCHAPHSQPQPEGKFQLEIFPHPVTIHLFGLQKILKYKKGRLAERRPELEQLRQYQLSILPTLDPPLVLTEADLPPIPEKGAAMKAVEDQLDSLTCAYAAAYWWYWGINRNWVLGDRHEGYIVVPAPREEAPSNSIVATT
jgi:predicted RNase H-like nuclease